MTLGVPLAYKSDIMKFGLLKCREEPPKLLQGTRFQERSFQIKDHKLLLLKDKKVEVTGSQRVQGGRVLGSDPWASPREAECSGLQHE